MKAPADSSSGGLVKRTTGKGAASSWSAPAFFWRAKQVTPGTPASGARAARGKERAASPG